MLPIILSIIPFIVFFILLLLVKMSLIRTSLIMLAIFTALSIFYWKILPSFLFMSFGKGFFIALDIFIVIFGAIFFLKILKDLNIIKNISYYLENFSKDYRIQIILLAWLFGNFLEGTAGFGTSVLIIAPLLIGLGLSPIRALIVSLIGNSTAVVFGAAGTPIRVGFAGLDFSAVPLLSSFINCVGIIIPIFILWMITSGRKDKKSEFMECLPFAIWSGLVFVIPSIFAVFLGQEFPSILGSAMGIILVIISTKLGIFIPKENKTLILEKEIPHNMSAFKSFLPYGLLILFLILGKFIIGETSILISTSLSHSFKLFNPGFIFIITGLFTAFLWKSKKEILPLSAINAFKRTIGPFLVIISMSTVVQIMINSGQNYSGIPAAIALIAKGFETNTLPFFAPFIGAFGSFVTGSATVSNIMFGNFFNTAAQALGFKAATILSLGVVGAAAGNMVALSNILAGEAVVGLKNEERQILKGVFIPCLIYLIIVGIIGIIIV